jgi:hypothetical protein
MRSASSLPLSLLVCALASVPAVAAFAADGIPDNDVPAAPHTFGAGKNGAPRFTRSDTPDAQPSAAGLRNESSEVAYRWWASSGLADLGVGLGAATLRSSATGTVPGLVVGGNGNVIASSTVLTVGMRYRTSPQSSVYADASSWRGNGADSNDGVAGKVGLEFKSSQSRFNVAYGGLGMRLTGDSRMTVRLRRGGLGLFMKREF